MNQLQFFASPWWINLFFLVPFTAYYFWQGRLAIGRNVLAYTAVFGVAFGYTEAAAVVYLRSTAPKLKKNPKDDSMKTVES